MQNVNDILLDWYDEHARELPWRVSPVARANGTAPDPYAVWMSEIMLQQTTVAAVKAYFNRFMIKWPTINELANAEDADVMAEWAGLGYYARARNLLKCAREVKKRGGFPETEAGLREMSNGLWRVFLRLLILCPHQNRHFLTTRRNLRPKTGPATTHKRLWIWVQLSALRNLRHV